MTESGLRPGRRSRTGVAEIAIGADCADLALEEDSAATGGGNAVEGGTAGSSLFSEVAGAGEGALGGVGVSCGGVFCSKEAGKEVFCGAGAGGGCTCSGQCGRPLILKNINSEAAAPTNPEYIQAVRFDFLAFQPASALCRVAS